MTLRFRVTSETAGRQLQSICRRELHLSAAQLRKLKSEQGLLVNGSPAFASSVLAPGDEIIALLREDLPDYPPEPGELHILYEDALMLALDKPQGIIVHPTHSRNTGTLANAVWSYLLSEGEEGCHAVNRLDRDTGGVVLFAKNAWSCRLLGEALAAPETEKNYLAAVYGVPDPPGGRIELPIRRPDPRDLRREAGEPGEAAATEYSLLETAQGCSLVRLRLLTGRTHQIRVHMSAMGWPVLGDRLYASPESAARSAELGQTDQALHCTDLSFSHPLSGIPLHFHSSPEWSKLKFFSFLS